MISTVCVYNDESVMEDRLLKSLRDQIVEFELIKIDNTKNRFKSGAEALNYGGRKAKGRFIMFVHQDVSLYGNSWLRNVESILQKLPDLGVAGPIGRKSSGEFIGFMKDRTHLLGKPFGAPTFVQTLDECCLIIPKKIFDLLRFDSRLTGWHAYGADYCLSVQRLSLKAYAIPAFIRHDSPTQNLEGLDEAHRYLWAKHGSFYDKVVTTVGVLPDKWNMRDHYRGWKKTMSCWIPSSVKKIRTCLQNQLFKRPQDDLPSYIHNNLVGQSVDILFATDFEHLASYGLPEKIVSNSFKPLGYSRSFSINNHFIHRKEQLEAYNASPDVIILTHGIINKFKNTLSDIVSILQKAGNQIWIVPEPDQKQYSHINEYLRLFSQYDWHIEPVSVRSGLKMTTQYVASSFVGR